MKTFDIGDAALSIASYGRGKRRETWVLTRRGKPIAAVVPLDNDDALSMRLANDPGFVRMIEASRASAVAEGTVPLAEVERQLGITPRNKRRPRVR